MTKYYHNSSISSSAGSQRISSRIGNINVILICCNIKLSITDAITTCYGLWRNEAEGLYFYKGSESIYRNTGIGMVLNDE